tara:strand:+ start:858 stop:1355 length:498 start_codon:yes stop_codon:yes gene_type:complete
MTTDINKIRISLKNCEEILPPYKFPLKCWIKYITLKNDDEYFYEGGEFIRMGDHKLFINEKGRSKCIPTCIRSDDGEIMYRSRFFIDNEKQITCEKDKYQLLTVINSQQSVIKRSSEQIKLLEDKANEYQSDNYELRIELEEKNNLIKELLIKEKKYKILLSQYM